MADASITDLPNSLTSSTIADADFFVADDTSASAETKKITWANIKAALAAVFASITGEAAVNTVGASGSTETLTLAPVHRVTLDANCTFTFPTPTAASHTFQLRLSGAFTPTFPASVDWADATAPTYATPSLYVFTTDDTGTTWYGALVGSAFG
jgi:hypothetical protein